MFSVLHLRIFSETLGKSLSYETVFLHGIVHSDVVSLPHIRHEWPESKILLLDLLVVTP